LQISSPANSSWRCSRYALWGWVRCGAEWTPGQTSAATDSTKSQRPPNGDGGTRDPNRQVVRQVEAQARAPARCAITFQPSPAILRQRTRRYAATSAFRTRFPSDRPNRKPKVASRSGDRSQEVVRTATKREQSRARSRRTINVHPRRGPGEDGRGEEGISQSSSRHHLQEGDNDDERRSRSAAWRRSTDGMNHQQPERDPPGAARRRVVDTDRKQLLIPISITFDLTIRSAERPQGTLFGAGALNGAIR